MVDPIQLNHVSLERMVAQLEEAHAVACTRFQVTGLDFFQGQLSLQSFRGWRIGTKPVRKRYITDLTMVQFPDSARKSLFWPNTHSTRPHDIP